MQKWNKFFKFLNVSRETKQNAEKTGPKACLFRCGCGCERERYGKIVELRFNVLCRILLGFYNTVFVFGYPYNIFNVFIGFAFCRISFNSRSSHSINCVV